MSEEELRKLREKLEAERDKRIDEAFQIGLKGRGEIAELKGAMQSVQTHVHDVDRKATAIGHALDEVRNLVQTKHDEQEHSLGHIKQELVRLKPASKFFADIQDRWMALLIIGLAMAAMYGLTGKFGG